MVGPHGQQRERRSTYVIGDENIERSSLTEDAHFVDGGNHRIEDFAFERSEDECLVFDVEGGKGSHGIDHALRMRVHTYTYIYEDAATTKMR